MTGRERRVCVCLKEAKNLFKREENGGEGSQGDGWTPGQAQSLSPLCLPYFWKNQSLQGVR